MALGPYLRSLLLCLVCLLSGDLTHASAVLHRNRQLKASSSSALDIALQGPCSSDILYHCSHILTEYQKQVVHGNIKPGQPAVGPGAGIISTTGGVTTQTSATQVKASTTGGGGTQASLPATSTAATTGTAVTVGTGGAAQQHVSGAQTAAKTGAGGAGGTATAGQVTTQADVEGDVEDDDEDDQDLDAFMGTDAEGEAATAVGTGVKVAGATAAGGTAAAGQDKSGQVAAGKASGATQALGALGDEDENYMQDGGDEVDDGDDDDEFVLTDQSLLQGGGARRLLGMGRRMGRAGRPTRRRLSQFRNIGAKHNFGGAGVWNTEVEVAQLLEQQSSLPGVLKRFGMDNAPIKDLAAANAPVARCLRHAIHEGILSLSPDAPHVGAECKLDVRNFFKRRSTDVSKDLPLLAACASDIEEHCASIHSPQRVLGCLKASKPDLLHVCKAAVTAHQIESAEDISLDPDLATACTADRDRLCEEVGWGDGIAQACLLSHIDEAIRQGASGPNQHQVALEGGIHRVSAACDAALLHRQMQDAEDIRFNYQLARACSMDKQALCSDVRPGRGGVLACLERYLMNDPNRLDAVCHHALALHQRHKIQDARLDYHFTTYCGEDVTALCEPDEVALLGNTSAPRGAGAAMLECLRAKQDRIRDQQCKTYVFGLAMAMYHDNTLDTRLQSACALDMGRCRNPSAAISCLRDTMRRYGDISAPCLDIVTSRLSEAASDLAFNPRLREACAVERLQFCSADYLQGGAVIDCLGDNRHAPDFGEGCRAALLDHLEHAVTDIRMMHSLRTACQTDISKLCSGIAPGEGRVVSCLQHKRGEIESNGCRTQILRLLGFVVEDARMDFRLMQACRADAQQYCAGVKSGGGALHECLRESWDHLSHECKQAEAEVETIENEDVRLNPRLQKACPHAITMFCSDITPGDARVITCLLNQMNKASFPGTCKKALSKLLDRSSVRYSLNPRLRRACEADVGTTCANTVDDPETLALGGQESTLACLAANSSTVEPDCRTEIAAAVKVQLKRYRMGMPLTSVCDGDVMTLCSVDMLTASFLERGYVQSCLVKHVSRLHAPCFALISMFDDKQYEHAVEMEKHWKGGMQDDQLQKVAAEVRRELEPHLLDRVTHKISHEVQERHAAMSPRIDALANTVAVLVVLVIAVSAVSLVLFRKRRGTFVIKNASN